MLTTVHEHGGWVPCEVCAKPVKARADRIVRFCSRQCCGKARAGKPAHNKGAKLGPKPRAERLGEDVPCAVCGNLVYVEPNQKGRKKFCSKGCFFVGRELRNTFAVGHPDFVPASSRGHSPATRAKMVIVNRATRRCGPDSPNWRGGRRTARKEAMAKFEYRDWRHAVFVRDDYTCQVCGVRGGALNADHIQPWALHPEVRYSVDNGRTLCVPCHRKTPTWGAHVSVPPKELTYG